MKLREIMKIGTKGQVVIPRFFRKQLSLNPGSEVAIELQDNHLLLEKPRRDIIKDFEMIAKSTKNFKFNKEEFYEQIEERWKRSRG